MTKYYEITDTRHWKDQNIYMTCCCPTPHALWNAGPAQSAGGSLNKARNPCWVCASSPEWSRGPVCVTVDLKETLEMFTLRAHEQIVIVWTVHSNVWLSTCPPSSCLKCLRFRLPHLPEPKQAFPNKDKVHIPHRSSPLSLSHSLSHSLPPGTLFSSCCMYSIISPSSLSGLIS